MLGLFINRLEGEVADRKAFPLRLEPETYEALQRWANDELRSLNAQIEFLLRRALQEAGRVRSVPSAQPVRREKR
jgi:hypothetical protein